MIAAVCAVIAVQIATKRIAPVTLKRAILEWRSSDLSKSVAKTYASHRNVISAARQRRKIGLNRCRYQKEEHPSGSKINVARMTLLPSRNGALVPIAARRLGHTTRAPIAAFTVAAPLFKSSKAKPFRLCRELPLTPWAATTPRKR